MSGDPESELDVMIVCDFGLLSLVRCECTLYVGGTES